MGPFFRSFPGSEAHKLFPGGPKWGLLGGGRKVYVEKVYVLFPSPNHYQINSLGVVLSKITEIIVGELSSGSSLQDFVHGISVRVSWDR